MAADDTAGRPSPPEAGAEIERIRAIIDEYEAAALPARPAASEAVAADGPDAGEPQAVPLGRLTPQDPARAVEDAAAEAEAELQRVHDHLTERQEAGELDPEHEPLLERASTTLDYAMRRGRGGR